MLLSTEDVLALRAATSRPESALAAWKELMSSVDFDAINESTQRIMPSIFLNVRGQNDIPDVARMRGAFKYAWSRTTEMLHSGRGLFLALNESGIDYRILKGAAVQVVSNRLGARTMADIDMLIGANDVERMIEIMNAQGFRRSMHSECSGHSSQSHYDAMDFNSDGCHIDVHVAQYKEPSALLQLMLSVPALHVRAAGAQLPLPPPELLLLHAAFHGAQAAGPTDFVQSVVDVLALGGMVDHEQLVEQARQSGTLEALLALNAATQTVDDVSLHIKVPVSAKIRARLQAQVLRGKALISESNSMSARIAERRPSKPLVSLIRDRFQGKTRLYLTWLRTGRFAVTERFVVRLTGGFLEVPQHPWVSGTTLVAFGNSLPGSIVGSTTAREALDWRFRVRFATPEAMIRVRLISTAFDRLDAYLFCNGRGVARVIAGDISSRSVTIRNVPASAEFSLRAFWDVCPLCYQGFDDLQVRIDLGDVAGA